jgi:hypothetical protein
VTVSVPLPQPRGSLSRTLLDVLVGSQPAVELAGAVPDDREDEQLALWLLYSLHHRAWPGVDDALEWDAGLLALRGRLETSLEERLRDRFAGEVPDGDVGQALLDLVAAYDGPALSPHVQSHATVEQVLELLRHRSIYHLHEFDSTAWTVPRLPVRAKATLVEVGYDEYGAGDPARLHSHLFARGLASVGLDPAAGAYVDVAPVEILEQNNAMSLFGLHRRLRGAALGHFAAFEASSSAPSRRMVKGLQRLGLGEDLVAYYDEHVEADSVHDQLACRVLCVGLVEDEPDLREDVFWGAFTCLDLESRYAAAMLERWQLAVSA